MTLFRTSVLAVLLMTGLASVTFGAASERPRVLVTTDGEVDDECSMVRFLLYENEWDIEGIVYSSSQYHWQGSKLWAGTNWVNRYLVAYAEVWPNLRLHDARFPDAKHLRDKLYVGNIKAEGEMDEQTPGSQHIVEVLLDTRDPRPVWIQAWGGTNTIARALRTIQERHPDRMAEVARKARLYLIWEQDDTYQRYIRPNWEKLGLQTIISDQFIVFFYHWKKYLPAAEQVVLSAPWMKEHLLENHGPLCSLYKARGANEAGFSPGDFRSEGDSPAFLHVIPNGLRSDEAPDWGGWGGRFVRVRANTWLDPVQEAGYQYPEGRWFTETAWGRVRLRKEIPQDAELTSYLEPQWRWLRALQNDFAARADWCVRDFASANHAPLVTLHGEANRRVKPGEVVRLSASGTDPDGNRLQCRWWRYDDADTAQSPVQIVDASSWSEAHFVVPNEPGRTLHVVLEVTDDGSPSLASYRRLVFQIQ